MRRVVLLALGVAVLCFVFSCGTTRPLYDWKGYDTASFKYTKETSEESLASLLWVYAKLVESNGGTRAVPGPGICADYGYLLILNGELEKGKELLVKETILYPESKIFIDRILKRFDK